MYKEQMRNNRYFVHEHPDTATSWQVPCIENIAQMPEVKVARADLCMFGLRSKDKLGEAPAKKPTKFMTNSVEIHKMLNHQCDGTCHRHVHLMEGRAKAAAASPGRERRLCREKAKEAGFVER